MKVPRKVGYEELVTMFPGFDDPENLISIPIMPRRRYGQVDYNELAIISAIVRAHNPTVIFEFGRFDGLTTLCLAQSATDTHIFTLDLPDEIAETRLPSDEASYAKDASDIARRRWKNAGVSNRITEVLIDSADFEPSGFEKGSLVGKVDLVFIDGNHNYNYIRRDTENALRMLSPRGILMWHDYYKRSFPGVTAFLAEFAEARDVYWIQSPGEPDFLETSLCYYMGSSGVSI